MARFELYSFSPPPSSVCCCECCTCPDTILLIPFGDEWPSYSSFAGGRKGKKKGTRVLFFVLFCFALLNFAGVEVLFPLTSIFIE